MAYCSLYFVFALIKNSFTIEIEKSLNLPCIKLKVTIISVKCGFHVTPHEAPGNTKGKCYETFHTLKLSLDPLNLLKNTNRTDLKIYK